MNLYIIRHVEALPAGEGGIETDEDRSLTEKGFLDAAAIGRWMRRQLIIPEIIFASPLVRAQQTASTLMASATISSEHLHTLEDLAPGFRGKKLARCLNGLSETCIAIVGHQPDLSKFCGWLIGSKRALVRFEKGAIAAIEVSGAVAKGTGILNWLITPELIQTRQE